MKKRLVHIWFYYKWYLLAAAAVLVLLLNFFYQKSTAPRPDYYVSIVTGRYVDEQTREEAARRLEEIWDDGSGVTVTVNLYRYDGRPEQAEDTSAFMAAAVQLAGDLQERISVCYLTDCPQALNSDGVLQVLCEVEDSRLAGIPALEGFQILYYGDNGAQVEKLAE